MHLVRHPRPTKTLQCKLGYSAEQEPLLSPEQQHGAAHSYVLFQLHRHYYHTSPRAHKRRSPPLLLSTHQRSQQIRL